MKHVSNKIRFLYGTSPATMEGKNSSESLRHGHQYNFSVDHNTCTGALCSSYQTILISPVSTPTACMAQRHKPRRDRENDQI